jgi:hypothetical protein
LDQRNRTGGRRTRSPLAKALSAPWHATRWTGHALWATARAAGSFAGDQLPEALLLGGACALTYGIAQIYVPAAWIAGGLLLLLVGWRLGRPVPEVKSG